MYLSRVTTLIYRVLSAGMLGNSVNEWKRVRGCFLADSCSSKKKILSNRMSYVAKYKADKKDMQNLNKTRKVAKAKALKKFVWKKNCVTNRQTNLQKTTVF